MDKLMEQLFYLKNLMRKKKRRKKIYLKKQCKLSSLNQLLNAIFHAWLSAR